METRPLDQKAFAALSALPGNPFHQWVRHDVAHAKAARVEFERTGHTPLFTYPKAERLNVTGYLKEIDELLEHLPALCHNQPTVLDLYEGKVDELKTRALLVRAVQQQQDGEVTRLSRNLFGSPPSSQVFLEAFEHMQSSTKRFHVPEKPVTAEALERMVKELLSAYQMNDWSVGRHKGTSIKIKHGHHKQQPRVLIPNSYKATKVRTARVLAHEIETHALRTENGRKSPLLLLGRGLDRYMQTEEGLAIYFQQKIHKSTPSSRPGFWDAWAAALASEKSFAQVYETLAKARTEIARRAKHPQPELKGRDTAWRLCMRVYRGIHNPATPKVGYLRDHIYRTGLTRVETYLQQHGDDALTTLFRGNLGLEHVERVKNLNLPKAEQPKHLAQKVVEHVMG